MTVTYKQTNTSSLYIMVYNFEQSHKLKGALRNVVSELKTTCGGDGFRGIFIPELDGFLSFDAETVYQPIHQSALDMISKDGLVRGTKNYVIKLNGCVKSFIA